MLNATWDWLLPTTGDAVLRGRAGLVMLACVGLASAVVVLMAVWAITRDLERNTVAAFSLFILALLGIGVSAHNGAVSLAAWALVGLLLPILMFDVFRYGVGSLSASACVIPIILAACSLGMWPALGLATLASGAIWILAWGEQSGAIRPRLEQNTFHLTFSAPGLMVLFLLTAFITGVWSDYLSQALLARAG